MFTIFNWSFNKKEAPKEKNKGINFDYLIPFLTKEYKEYVVLSKDPYVLKNVFDISNKACESFYHKIKRNLQAEQ